MNEKPVVKNVIVKCGCDMILPLACVSSPAVKIGAVPPGV